MPFIRVLEYSDFEPAEILVNVDHIVKVEPWPPHFRVRLSNGTYIETDQTTDEIESAIAASYYREQRARAGYSEDDEAAHAADLVAQADALEDF